MKRIYILLFALVATLHFSLSAIELIQFASAKASILPEGTEAQQRALNLKLTQILGRNSSAAADPYCAFVIKPVLNVNDVTKSEGLTRNVSLIEGELTLSAVNAYDGTIYYTYTAPLETALTGSSKNPVDALISTIKVKDPAFTRFLRTARTKITEYYDANCERIITRAIHMHNQGLSAHAVAYLAAVSDVSPCYADAADIMTKIVRMHAEPQATPDSVASQPQTEPEPVPDTAPSPAPAPQPQAPEATQPSPEPAPLPAPDAAPVPAPATKQPKIYMSNNNFGFNLLSCVGSPVHRSITITCELTNLLNDNVNNAYTAVIDAYDAEGQSLEPQRPNSYYFNYPAGIKTKKQFSVSAPTADISSISFIKIKVNNTEIEIRDLDVNW